MSPLYFLKRLIEDESPDALKWTLKKKGLILNLNAEQMIHQGWSNFEIEFELTDLGMS